MGIIWFLGGNGRGGVQSLQKEFKGGTTENSLPMGGGAYLVLDTFTREQNMS